MANSLSLASQFTFCKKFFFPIFLDPVKIKYSFPEDGHA